MLARLVCRIFAHIWVEDPRTRQIVCASCAQPFNKEHA